MRPSLKKRNNEKMMMTMNITNGIEIRRPKMTETIFG